MSTKIFVNGHVYDSNTGTFDKKTIVIKDEYINSITNKKDVFEANEVFDATGLYITPGFIDTFSQIGLKETEVRWEGDDSYEPTMEDVHEYRAIDGIYPFDPAFKKAAAAGVTTAHVTSSANNVIGARTAIIHLVGQTVEDMAINDQFGYSFSMGDLPKTSYLERTKSPLTRMGIAKNIRTILNKIKNKHEDLEAVPIFIRSHRHDDISTALRIFATYQIKPMIVHATDLNKYDLIKDQSIHIIAGPTFQAILRNELKHLSPSLYYKLYEREIPFTFATDHPTTLGKYLQLEGALAMKYGVPEKYILNALTKHAAKLLQIDHLTGSIHKGLYADLVFWNKHPLELTAKVMRTLIRGKEVYKEATN